MCLSWVLISEVWCWDSAEEGREFVSSSQSFPFFRIWVKNGGRGGKSTGPFQLFQEDWQICNPHPVHQGRRCDCQAWGQADQRQVFSFINHHSFPHSADSTWMPGLKRSSTTSSISCKENQGKCQGSSASATPGTALLWRRLHCCSGSSPSSPTSPPPSLPTKGGESPLGLDCEKEGWLPAHFFPIGWRRRSATFVTSGSTCLPILLQHCRTTLLELWNVFRPLPWALWLQLRPWGGDRGALCNLPLC